MNAGTETMEPKYKIAPGAKSQFSQHTMQLGNFVWCLNQPDSVPMTAEELRAKVQVASGGTITNFGLKTSIEKLIEDNQIVLWDAETTCPAGVDPHAWRYDSVSPQTLTGAQLSLLMEMVRHGDARGGYFKSGVWDKTRNAIALLFDSHKAPCSRLLWMSYAADADLCKRLGLGAYHGYEDQQAIYYTLNALGRRVVERTMEGSK